jgi:hypothetical protein
VSDERDDHPLPPDPAGTQPKVERASLLPARVERLPEPAPEPEVLLPELPPLEAAGEAPHAEKFQFILGALLAIGLVGLVALGIIAADRATEASKPAWSAWKPQTDGLDGAKEIADHVATGYKGSNGKQLALVTAHDFEVELEAADVPMQVALRQGKEEGGAIKAVDGDTVLYRFCGLASRCTLGGKPHPSRKLLLQREALELALYTFKYLDDVDQVVLFMPPAFADVPDPKTKKHVKIRIDNQAVRFSRKELEPLLDLPVRATLPGPPPPVKKALTSREAAQVASTTDARSFTYSLVPANGQDRVFLVLEHLTGDEAIIRQQQQRLDAAKAEAEAAGGLPIEPEGNN